LRVTYTGQVKQGRDKKTKTKSDSISADFPNIYIPENPNLVSPKKREIINNCGNPHICPSSKHMVENLRVPTRKLV